MFNMKDNLFVKVRNASGLTNGKVLDLLVPIWEHSDRDDQLVFTSLSCLLRLMLPTQGLA
jgi:hypothetical protein